MPNIEEQLKKIAIRLQSNIEKAMKEEVAVVIVKEAKNKVDEMVYSYKPKIYERTGELRDSWETVQIDNGILVRNTREDEGKYIPQVIETGDGYDYTGYGYEYEEPRPFIEATREEIVSKGKHIKALKKGLKKQGLKIR